MGCTGVHSLQRPEIPMMRVGLTDEQSRLVAASAEEVQLTDSRGRVLGLFVPRVSEADLLAATASLQSSERRSASAEVIEQLEKLRVS